MPADRSVHPAGLTRREALLFEAGIKLGGVFHQYLGTPVSGATAPGLGRAIERAVALQPYVADVRVAIDPSRGGPLGRGRYAYRYLIPPMLDVTVHLRDDDLAVEARLAHEGSLRYSLMRVVRVGSARGPPRSPRRRRA